MDQRKEASVQPVNNKEPVNNIYSNSIMFKFNKSKSKPTERFKTYVCLVSENFSKVLTKTVFFFKYLENTGTLTMQEKITRFYFCSI